MVIIDRLIALSKPDRSDKLDKLCDKQLFLYGLGTRGEFAYKLLRHMGIQVAGFVLTAPTSAYHYDGGGSRRNDH